MGGDWRTGRKVETKLVDRAKNAWAVLLACGPAVAIAGCEPTGWHEQLAGDDNHHTHLRHHARRLGQGFPRPRAIVDFVSASTDEDSASHIPPEDCIAVLDMNGTLMGERFPTYFIDWLCVWCALHHETYEALTDIKIRDEGRDRDVLTGKEMS